MESNDCLFDTLVLYLFNSYDFTDENYSKFAAN